MCGSGSAAVAVGSGAAAGRAEAATHPALDAVTPPGRPPPRPAAFPAGGKARALAGRRLSSLPRRALHARLFMIKRGV